MILVTFLKVFIILSYVGRIGAVAGPQMLEELSKDPVQEE